MIHVIARSRIVPGKREEFLEIFRANIPAVLAEPGCIAYTPCIDFATGLAAQGEADPDTVTILETWKSLDDLHSHLATPHMKRYAAAVAPLRLAMTMTVVEPA